MSYFEKSRFVTELKPADFDGTKVWELKDKKCGAIMFYAPWCPYCKETKPVWEELGRLAAFYDVYAFDCEKHKDHCLKIQHDMPELISGYPSIIIYNKGKPVEKIGGSGEERTLGKLTSAIMRVCS